MNRDKFIKPNIFLYKNFTNEDHFTNSLGYILNLFPEELGNRFLSKIAENAGFPLDYFGEFIEAKFTGHHLQNEDSTSKPDLVIHTTKRNIYFEIKLRASLSENQLERHFIDVDRDNGYLLLISNIKHPISENIISRKNYIKPINNKHFIWSQFELIFEIKYRKGGLKGMLLENFKQSLRSNGIKGRQIVGTEDNLYSNGSEAENLVLDALQEILKKIGFKAWRKKQEYTLRVNIEKAGKNPLLNPRIYPTGEWLDDSCTQECLIIYCYAKSNEKFEIQQLNKLDVLHDFFPEVKMYDEYSENLYIYYIYIPLKFVQKGKSFEIDWIYLKIFWEKIYKILKGSYLVK